MANKSARDKCFEEAMDDLNDNLPENEKIPIKHQKPWGQGDDAKWKPLGLMERLWDWIKDPDKAYRVPDWTLEIDGKPVAGDNKFEGDGYTKKRGRSGKTQLEDQNQMNQDQQGDSKYKDLHLNPGPDSCKCEGEPEKQEVRVPVPALSPVMVPGVGLAPGVGPVGLPAIPSFGGPITVPGGFMPVLP